MKRILAFAVLASSLALAQAPPVTAYLDLNSPLAADFSAALIRKNVPITVTTDPASARYNITFQMYQNNGSVFQGITSAATTGSYDPGRFDRATIQVVDNQTKTVAFSYTCKKYKGNYGDPLQSAAECLAKHWKEKLPK
jgi:hypothetical protein